jgi:hypothetical protein
VDDVPPLLRPGDRVIVATDDPWGFCGATGVVAPPPTSVREFFGDDWREYWRVETTLHGSRVLYWIVFDEPQIDDDGDGPYSEAEIAGRQLRRLGED